MHVVCHAASVEERHHDRGAIDLAGISGDGFPARKGILRVGEAN